MYEIFQIIAKVVIISAILLIAGFAALRVWRADIDLGQLINPRRAVDRSASEAVDWLPTRDPTKIYQDGQVVGSVYGANINEEAGIITFEKVDKAIDLDLKKEFEFQKWCIRYKKAGTSGKIGGLAMNTNLVFGNMECEIIGRRGAF